MFPSHDPDKNTRFRNALVIESKFECPTFDFSGVSGSSPVPYGLYDTVGMWHQKPKSLNSQTRLSILSPEDFGDNEAQDLSKLLGLKLVKGGTIVRDRSITLGDITNSKQVSEAVVMVPYIDTPNGAIYFTVPEAKLYKAVRNKGYINYQSDYTRAYTLSTRSEDLPDPARS